jgi:hypothetical protein
MGRYGRTLKTLLYIIRSSVSHARYTFTAFRKPLPPPPPKRGLIFVDYSRWEKKALRKPWLPDFVCHIGFGTPQRVSSPDGQVGTVSRQPASIFYQKFPYVKKSAGQVHQVRSRSVIGLSSIAVAPPSHRCRLVCSLRC